MVNERDWSEFDEDYAHSEQRYLDDVQEIVDRLEGLAADGWETAGDRGYWLRAEAQSWRARLNRRERVEAGESAAEDRERKWRNQRMLKRQPRCEGERSNGQPCRSTRKPGSPFCHHHQDSELVSGVTLDWGAE